jgi:hypothetical protein
MHAGQHAGDQRGIVDAEFGQGTQAGIDLASRLGFERACGLGLARGLASISQTSWPA